MRLKNLLYLVKNPGILILATIFLAYMATFLYRNNVLVLINDRSFTNVFGISSNSVAQGMLVTVLLLFTGITAFFSGPLVNRWGARMTMNLGLAITAVLMAVMGSISSLPLLLVCRALLGMFIVLIGPSTSKLVQAWYPAGERSKANGIWSLGMLTAQVITMPLVTGMVTSIGWRGSYFALVLIGIVPLAFSVLFIRNSPEGRSGPDLATAPVEKNGKTSNGFSFLKKSNFWYGAIVASMINAISWGFSTWMPTYFMKTLGFSFSGTGWLTALPYLLGGVSILLVTPLMDKRNLRSHFILFGLLGCGALSLIAMNVSNTAVVVAIFCLVFVFAMPITPALYTIMQNTTEPSEVANAHGFYVGLSFVFASIFPSVMGAIFDYTGVLKDGFYLLIAIVAVAVVFSIPLIRRRL